MNKLIRIIGFVFLLGLTSTPLLAQSDSELIKLSDYFGKYYQYTDEARLAEALSDDFRYFTNGPCGYKDCSVGATKANYISGIVDERKANGFTVESISMTYIAPIAGASQESAERKVSFYCQLKTRARGNQYKFYSVIDYYFQRSNGVWKITKIENRIIN